VELDGARVTEEKPVQTGCSEVLSLGLAVAFAASMFYGSLVNTRRYLRSFMFVSMASCEGVCEVELSDSCDGMSLTSRYTCSIGLQELQLYE
jgi:hypothetical protein